MCQLVNEF